MTREIKFRAWDEKEKCWVSGFAIHQSGMFSDWAGCKKINGQCVADADWKYQNEIPHIKIMQYTGLHDLNGREIYEGDIVRYKPCWNELIGVVCFGHYSQDGSGGEYRPRPCVGFYVERKVIIPSEWDDGEVYPREEEEQMSIAEQEYEVIGNIYENPELLQEEWE